MRIYTIHAPRPRFEASRRPALETVTLEPEGFSWRAFLFGPFWLAASGLWLATLAWLAAAILYGILAGLAMGLGASTSSLVLGAALLELLFGLEAFELRRHSLERAGRPALGLVYARNSAEAFGRFVRRRRRVAGSAESPPSPSAASTDDDLRRGRSAAFIGLFPDGTSS